MQRDDQAELEQLERALHQLLLFKRIADLNGRPLVIVGVAELSRSEHRGAADPVAAGRGSINQDYVADTGCGAAHQLLARAESQRHRVDEAVLFVSSLEVDLAADRRHADRVAVMADPSDGVLQQIARALARFDVAKA